MTQVWFWKSPVHEPMHCFDVPAGLTVAEILAKAETPDWFSEHGGVYLDGVKADDGTWHVRSVAEARVDLVVVPGSKKILPVLLSVAAVALTAGIGAFGVPFLGAGFAAGTFGASAVAAGVGLGSQLLISALTAPPKIGQASGGTQRQIGEGGVTQNPVVRWELLPNVLGTMRVSPPLLAPPYTYIDGDDTWTEAVVGLEGHYSIDPVSIKINGGSIGSFQAASFEVREGGPDDAPRTIANKTIIEQRDGVRIAGFSGSGMAYSVGELLFDQQTPDNSAAPWHYFKTDGSFERFSLRFTFPGGASGSGVSVMVPLRIEVRKVGDTTWRRFPTIHTYDKAAGRGPVRFEVAVVHGVPPSGPQYSCIWAENWPVYELNAWTGIGQSFEYLSDAYFRQSVESSILPVMTGPTTSGVTISSNVSPAGFEAWRAAVTGGGNYWQTTTNPGTVYWEVEFPSPQTIRSYSINNISALASSMMPGIFWMEAWDGTQWVRLDDEDIDQSAAINFLTFIQVGMPGSYSKYRLYISSNRGAANGVVRMSLIKMFTHNCPGSQVNTIQSSGAGGGAVTHNAYPNEYRVKNVSIDRDGCKIYLDPSEWDAGDYEVRVKRGWTFDVSGFTVRDYAVLGFVQNADFFEYRTDASGYKYILYNQDAVRADLNVDVFSTQSSDAPFDASGIAHVAVRAKNITVSSISFDATRRQRLLSDGVWADEWVPSSNPASQMRDILLGMSNHEPIPGEIIAEDELKAWFERCFTAGYACNAYVQGDAIADVLQMVASCGYASPRTAEVWGVVEDYDTSAEPVRMVISPINSIDQGTSIELPKTPHVVQVEFSDAADDYKTGYALVYAAGYDATNLPANPRTETWQMRGHTSEASAVVRAAFDLAQTRLRKFRYSFLLGLDGFMVRRGDIVGIASDVLDRTTGFAVIKTVTRNGSNQVTAVTLDNVINWSVAQTDFGTVGNVDDLGNVDSTAQTMAMAIQKIDGTVIQKDVTDTVDAALASFATPFVDDDVVPGLMVATGVSGRVFRRARVLAVEPVDGIETRRVTLVDEAPELFA